MFLQGLRLTLNPQELVWLIANNLDFDRASTLPQVRFKILTVKDLCVGLSFSISRDGKCHILE